MRYNLQAIRTFLAVAEAKGFRRAADQLGMAVATVSQHISALEAELGVTLLERTTRRVALTKTGASYFSYCQKVLRELEEISEGARHNFREPTGLLKVSIAGAFGRQVIAPIVFKFMAKNPYIHLDLIPTGQHVDMLGDAVDVAIRVGTPREIEPVRVKEFMPVTRLLCASPEYIKEYGMPETPEDLVKHQCIVHSHRPYHREWRLYTDTDTMSAVPVDSRLAVNDPALMLSACLAGLGIAVTPDIYARSYLEDGQLIRILPMHRPKPGNLHATYHADGLLFPKVVRFLEFMETELTQVLQ